MIGMSVKRTPDYNSDNPGSIKSVTFDFDIGLYSSGSHTGAYGTIIFPTQKRLSSNVFDRKGHPGPFIW